jgi:signal transduction histidine kinase
MAKFIGNLKSRLILLFVLAIFPALVYIVYFSLKNQILSQTILIVIGILLVGLGIIFFGSNVLLLSPIDKIIHATKQMELGNLSARVNLQYMVGEIKHIAYSFNKMADEVENRELILKTNGEKIQKQALQMESLMQIGRKINYHLNINLVLQTICEEVIQALKISACSVRLYDQDRDAFFLVAQSGLPDSIIQTAGPLEQSVYKLHCIEEESFVKFHEPDIDPALPDDLNENKIRGDIFSLKMMQEDFPIGLLVLYVFSDNLASNLDDGSFIDDVAVEASLAIANAKLYETLQQEENKKLGLVQRLISIQEEERIHIARELHDVTSQNLSAIRIMLDTITLSMDSPNPKAILYIKSIRTIIDTILEDTHRMIWDLRPSILDDLGLVAAISWYAEQRLSPSGIGFQFGHENFDCRLTSAIETTLFRISQEIITNIVRHSKASFVDILLCQEKNSVILIISDNGQGFDPNILNSGQNTCYGLTGIEERVNMLDGKYQVSSSKYNGTTIEIVIPLQKR